MYSSLDVIKQQFATELPPRYSDRECLSLFYQIIEYSTGLRKVDVVLNPSKEVTEVQANEINDLLNASKTGRSNSIFGSGCAFYEPCVLRG